LFINHKPSIVKGARYSLPSKRVLNLGCGHDKHGTDFVDAFSERSDVLKCNVDDSELPYEDETFDEVYSKNLFEHIRNPNLVLLRIRRVLKKGGVLVLITDNAGYWKFHLPNSTHTGAYESRRGISGDRHYAVYTPWHIQNHLVASGFRVESISYSWFEDERVDRIEYRSIQKAQDKVLSLIPSLRNLAHPRICAKAVKI
jgi:SAM-dependent methyltransferase